MGRGDSPLPLQQPLIFRDRGDRPHRLMRMDNPANVEASRLTLIRG